MPDVGGIQAYSIEQLESETSYEAVNEVSSGLGGSIVTGTDTVAKLQGSTLT